MSKKKNDADLKSETNPNVNDPNKTSGSSPPSGNMPDDPAQLIALIEKLMSDGRYPPVLALHYSRGLLKLVVDEFVSWTGDHFGPHDDLEYALHAANTLGDAATAVRWLHFILKAWPPSDATSELYANEVALTLALARTVFLGDSEALHDQLAELERYVSILPQYEGSIPTMRDLARSIVIAMFPAKPKFEALDLDSAGGGCQKL